MKSIPKTLLLILDGYGLAPESAGNAAKLANTPFLDKIVADKNLAQLNASGEFVGLPAGFIGNSEVGHLNIGAGRVVLQDMKAVDAAIASGDFYKNPALLELCAKIKNARGRLHLMGLLSDGGVHSHINHIKALLRLAKEQNVPVYLHAFMDGRDTSPTSGVNYIQEILAAMQEYGGKLASVCGRFYAMDRDKRWERVEKAWHMLVDGAADTAGSAADVLAQSYASNITDEFIEPHLFLPKEEATVQDNDGIFFFNFRADRARELVHAFLDKDFSGFERKKTPKVFMASMTACEADLPLPVAFGKDVLPNTLGEWVAMHGFKQLRIAETEKYAHVTYFFSGGREEVFAGEERILVNSPKDVATYDLKPEMSVFEVTEKLVAAIKSAKFDFIVCNLANPDMVGHTGNLAAAVKACEAVNTCVEKIVEAAFAENMYVCVTADHGNVEEMIDSKGKPQTAHSMNKVPFLLMHKDGSLQVKKEGKLGDIAPTLLALWKQEQPAEMDGQSLLQEKICVM